MMEISFKYIPLSFISSKEEIKRQTKNTIIMRYVFDKYGNTKKLHELLEETKYGYTDSAKDSGSHKFLRITDISEGKVDWETVPFCNCENDEYLLQENDILIARTGGTTGKSFIVKELQYPSVFASYLIRLRVSNKLNPDFLYIFLNSYAYWNQIVSMKMGSAQPNVNAKKLKELMVPYCDLETQNNILNMYYGNDLHNDADLYNLKRLIHQIDYKIDLIEELKLTCEQNINLANMLRQSILQEAVQGKLVPQDPNDEPASVLLEKIKEEKERLIKEGKIKKEKPLPPISEDEIPYELPKGWEWVRLGEISAIVGGGTPKTNIKDYWENGDIPWLTPADLSNIKGKYISKGRRNITKLGLEKSSAQLMPKGTVLFSSRAPIGYTAIASNPLSTNQGFKSCIPYVMQMNEYIYYYLTYSAKKINEQASGTTFKEVSGSEVANFLLPLPPLREQKRIVEKVDQLMALCDELERNIEQSKKDSELLMQSVLQEAFKEA